MSDGLELLLFSDSPRATAYGRVGASGQSHRFETSASLFGMVFAPDVLHVRLLTNCRAFVALRPSRFSGVAEP
jgi:hypothetical protein